MFSSCYNTIKLFNNSLDSYFCAKVISNNLLDVLSLTVQRDYQNLGAVSRVSEVAQTCLGLFGEGFVSFLSTMKL